MAEDRNDFAAATDPEFDVTAVQWLIGCATASGADPVRVQIIANQLVDALLDREAFRRGDHDPRRQRTLKLARRVVEARDAGADIRALMDRFGKSEPRIYALIALATSREESARQLKSLINLAGDSNARLR